MSPRMQHMKKKKQCSIFVIKKKGKEKAREIFCLSNVFGSLFIVNAYENVVVGTQIFWDSSYVTERTSCNSW